MRFTLASHMGLLARPAREAHSFCVAGRRGGRSSDLAREWRGQARNLVGDTLWAPSVGSCH